MATGLRPPSHYQQSASPHPVHRRSPLVTNRAPPSPQPYLDRVPGSHQAQPTSSLLPQQHEPMQSGHPPPHPAGSYPVTQSYGPMIHAQQHTANPPPPPPSSSGGVAVGARSTHNYDTPPVPAGPAAGHPPGNASTTPMIVNAQVPPVQQQPVQASPLQLLSQANEQTWIQIANIATLQNDHERALSAYESALRHNPYSIQALEGAAGVLRAKENFSAAIEYFKRILHLNETNGEIWSALGHCHLMTDQLQEAYNAYQQALYHLKSPKDPKLWYGIGILYDRYGSFELAEDAFSAVIKMDPQFDKANEIYFRLGIIYKQLNKLELSLSCFRYILHNPPRPLTETDIWFQMAHVYEQQKDFLQARDAYERVLHETPDHAKVLQQLGWLYHQPSAPFSNQEQAVTFLTRSLKSDSNDPQSWYLLGRCYMVQQNYSKAYEAYQQAVYRDARNPTFWCSIGVLYYQIRQYRDALDAYSRAIKLNPYISEVWFNLGTLYESCNNQASDALDAYSKALELDPNNGAIRQRIDILSRGGVNGSSNTSGQPNGHSPQQGQAIPEPQDPSAYGSNMSGPQASGQPYMHPNQPPPSMPPMLPSSHVKEDANVHPAEGGLLSQQPSQDSLRYHQGHPRIPDIGDGGGMAPTPSDSIQMNPMEARHDQNQTDAGKPAPKSERNDRNGNVSTSYTSMSTETMPAAVEAPSQPSAAAANVSPMVTEDQSIGQHSEPAKELSKETAEKPEYTNVTHLETRDGEADVKRRQLDEDYDSEGEGYPVEQADATADDEHMSDKGVSHKKSRKGAETEIKSNQVQDREEEDDEEEEEEIVEEIASGGNVGGSQKQQKAVASHEECADQAATPDVNTPADMNVSEEDSHGQKRPRQESAEDAALGIKEKKTKEDAPDNKESDSFTPPKAENVDGSANLQGSTGDEKPIAPENNSKETIRTDGSAKEVSSEAMS
ncbi:hypothetical protein BZG36_03089 [Bifiguratus adelaidae]|uniref:Uncharacterized protein n=1 Tax=Bifiguratus adelaidae TaxID=1938954 RepID=A0A261XZ77_9FUNG|nr:hypothetical protein BZG36_03089 [Bifiguratus adelaidae]